MEQRLQQENETSIQLFLSVPPGLEDEAANKLPALLLETANRICYRVGSGYLTVDLFTTDFKLVIPDLVQHPPLCIFAAFVSIGIIQIPRETFGSSKYLLAHVLGGFQRPTEQQQQHLLNASGSSDNNSLADLGLRWHNGLSVLRCTSSSLHEQLHSSLSNPAQDPNSISNSESIRFRASFDRGDVQHKGVRSQDLAAGLGCAAGKVFPSWKVDLENYDIEIMGRWIQEDLHEVQFKPESCEPSKDVGNSDVEHLSSTLPVQDLASATGVATSSRDMKMQAGMTLPLALSTCPYRFRPMDGRTSLKIEIAYTLLAMADPKPGDIVMDVCSGVGTIPIIGAAHYPGFFAGIEFVPHNVEKAKGNSKIMIEKANQEIIKLRDGNSINSHQLVRHPCLLVGDAKAVCWRSGTVDLVVSDLPWGQRESSHHYNCKLYPKLVKEIIRLLRVGGRAVLVTGERKLLQRQLDAPFAKPRLKLLQKREITIGFKVVVYELQRI